MKRNSAASIFVFFVAASFSTFSFAQESQPVQPPAVALDAKPVPTEWLYGEVNSVDVSGKTLTLTYLDYDTDIEKQATVSVDAKTFFENVKSLEEIKPEDMVSIDYIIAADGKNLAVSVGVERPEGIDDFDMSGAAPEEPKQQMKPAVENISAPPVADDIPESEEE